jgi:hypothetical protein
MAMNRIHFQPGLSMPALAQRFGTESQCAAALEAARWPNGFSCPRCGGAGHCVLRGGSCKVFQCQACRHQTSLIAGTVLQGTELPLTVWFLAISLISQAKTGLSALALKRHLGVSYPTAWLIHHKLMRAMEPSDGLACFNAVIDAGCVHQPTVVAGRKPKDLPEFKWVNTVLGNLKTSFSRLLPRACLPKVWRSVPRGLHLPIQPPIRSQDLERAAPARRRSLLAAAPALDSGG